MIGVYYPRGAETGGPEALHQLVDSLRRQAIEAYLIPMPGTESRPPVRAYEKYDAPELGYPSARFHKVVAPEIFPRGLEIHSIAKPYLWWLAAGNNHSPDRYNHLAQSAFAKDTLRKQGIESRMLSDYTTYVENIPSMVNSSGKVAYNGNKGADAAREVAKLMPDVEFVEIKGMSQREVRQTLRDVTIYLDLGHHPGKDRMPREAAVSGAVVVTNFVGSAGYYEDVPIMQKVGLGPKTVAHNLRNTLSNAQSHYASQKRYRQIIEREPQVFDRQVLEIFE